MRDLLIFALVLGSIPFIFKQPPIGIMVFTWLSLMNPHRLAYGSAYDFPFAAIIGAVTIVSIVFSKQPKKLPITPVTVLMLMLMVWMSITSLFALEPTQVWREWDRVMKTYFVCILATMAINTATDIKRFVWVIALSLGIYGLKGGIFSALTGGQYRIYGPAGSYIGENNSLALGLLMVIPLLWYLKSQVKSKVISAGLVGITLATAIAVVCSYSRGGLLGGAVMLTFLWLKGDKKLKSGLMLGGMVAVIYLFMPDQWFARMDTIGEYQEDASSLGRFNAWKFGVAVANDNLFGGGFNVFTPRMFLQYAPDPLDYHVAHSIYFQALGELGYVGLTLFLLVMFFAWRTGTRVIRHCAGNAELKWAGDLAKMAQVSIIGYSVGGAFLSLAWFDLYYDIVIILVLLEKLLLLQKKPHQYARPGSLSEGKAVAAEMRAPSYPVK